MFAAERRSSNPTKGLKPIDEIHQPLNRPPARTGSGVFLRALLTSLGACGVLLALARLGLSVEEFQTTVAMALGGDDESMVPIAERAVTATLDPP